MSDKASANEAFVREYQTRRGLKPDGWAGTNTLTDLDKLVPAIIKLTPKPEPLTTGELDARSTGNIEKLHIKLQPIAKAFMLRVRAELGDFRITSGLRSYAEQNELYKQGRSKPGSVVTNAQGGYSNHNFGLAFDITLFKDGKPVWDSPLYDKAGAVGESLGLDWGGRWRSLPDRPHYEYKHGKTLAQLRALVASGKDVLS
jgi:peptidoglycan L-alanyl-D-glutamate endopeptidase CwlK